MRINPNYTPDILTDLWQAQAQEQIAIQELATGRRVNVPSDDPAAAAQDVQNQALQRQNDQYLQNTSNLESLFQTTDSALSSVVTALNQAISLGTQGANGDLSAAQRQAIALQVQGLQNQVVQLGNTSYEGSYVFGGTATQSPPFTLDPSQPSGVRYDGNTSVNTVEVSPGSDLQTNLPGSQVFQGAGGDVMGALQQLITALQSNNTAGISTATAQVNSALSYVSQQRVFYGTAANQLNSNQSFLQKEQVSLQTQETSLVGADMAKAATDLSRSQTTTSATLAALAQILPQSLLNYLK